jgi:hypothetical protein
MPIYPIRNPLNPEWILVGPTRPGGQDILTEHQSQATASTLTALAQADQRRELEASSDRAATAGLSDAEAQARRRAAMAQELEARWGGRTLRGTADAPRDPRTARSTAPEDPRTMRPSGLMPSNDEAAIPTIGRDKRDHWLSDEELQASGIRLSQWASLDDLQTAGVVHKDMGLSEHRFHARIKAACRPEDQSCGWQVGSIVHSHLLKLRMQAAERGYRFEAGATGVAPRANPEYEPHRKPQGSIPAWMPPGRTSGVQPGDERLAINACMDAIRHNIAAVEATLRARKARRQRELTGRA